MDIPVLETQRLIIRGHTPADFPAYAAMWADPVVTRFIGGKPLNEEDAWAKFLRVNGHWAVLGFGFWSVVERLSGARVGELGFLNVKRTIEPPFHGTPEVGWAFVPSVHGKGYATEGVKAALVWGERHFGKVKMVCIIAPENTASMRVAEKCGFREKLRTTYHGDPTVVLERPASG
jgi:RimJ/RimL family protein N-acetyltransferase